MIFWVDSQLPPSLAAWLKQRFEVEAYSVRELGYRDAEDSPIFAAARESDAAVITKDSDFVQLLERHGPPPQVLWITLGNTSNIQLRAVLDRVLPQAMDLLRRGEPLVEIGG